MIYIVFIISLISAIVTLFIVSVKHQAGWPSPQEMFAMLLFWPNMFVALGCFFYSLFKLQDKTKRPVAIVVLVISLVMPIRGGYEAIYPKVKRDDDKILAYQSKLDEWSNLGAKVNPLLREYYLSNPSKCKFPYNDNEAEIDGFAEYAAKHGIPLKKGHIVDPWGDPVHFVIAHEGDRALKACGQFYGIADRRPDIITVGLLLGKPSHANTALGHQWALRNGYIPIYSRQLIK